MKPVDILCFGEPLYEFNQQNDSNFLAGHGGDVSNCAIAAARYGATVEMFAHLGDDQFADSFIELWKQENVRTEAVTKINEGETGVYFISHDTDGHHFSYRRKNSAASNIDVDDVSEELIEKASILHVSGISQAISSSASRAVTRAIDIANSTNTLVSYDTNLRLKLWSLDQARETIHASTRKCHVVLPSIDDACQLTSLSQPDKIVDFYLDQGCAVVALTMGENGVVIATESKREVLPSFNINSIDSTAAGDIFDGAFLANYAKHRDPFKSAKFANAAAALSTTRFGAVSSIPTKQEIMSFCNKHGGVHFG